MAPPINFDAPLAVIHIETVTAVVYVDGINLLTDPFFSPAGTEFDVGTTTLKIAEGPAFGPGDIPPIDAVLLSYEDNPESLTSWDINSWMEGMFTGFIVTAPSFATIEGKPNAIYFSGDTIYVPELQQMRNRFRRFPSFLRRGCAGTEKAELAEALLVEGVMQKVVPEPGVKTTLA
ncbi:25b77d6d-3726-4695-8041-0d971ba86d12 [Thermothielavioides terrestris]|uniref:25b77d6d-3726-4695-8041-0d971ba86d12 n=1 Tax=Thermothielavioides terrestris TaxID=2587410 RepID=A0A446B9T2_9PEZI|nr:25b77d6d-3726-4695-8041-0d971ba86d12 [Thermothielavioides terrestris]